MSGRGKGAVRLPHGPLAAGTTTLSGEAAHYLVRVLRLGAGERVVVFDPEARLEADAEIVEVHARRAVLAVGAPRPAPAPRRRSVTLVQGAAKGDKLDAIVRDATELGAARVVVAVTERSVARPPDERAARWRRIAVEAARQCGRGDVPSIEGPLPFAAALARLDGAPGACFDPRGDTAFAQVVRAAGPGALTLVVGPEGGLTDAEVEAAVAAGLTRASLGSLTLRTETVAAAALGAVLALDEP